jgi:CRISPR-associated exonuclease Cas4
MNDSDYIPIAALNQYAYCPHRCWRMFCAGEFIDNQYTIEGTSLHDRVHTLSEGHREETWQIRAIWLKSQQYKLIGKSDLIEAESGQLYPVEYKRGRKGEWDNDELQVCAQALCLEEMTGKTITTGYIYYAHSHQRQPVEISAQLREDAIATIQSVTTLRQTGLMPKAAYTQRCKGCSLYSQCLPQAADKVGRYQESI